jgi:hypothetical protein
LIAKFELHSENGIMAEYIHHKSLNIPNILPSKIENVTTLLQLRGTHQKDQLYLLKKNAVQQTCAV